MREGEATGKPDEQERIMSLAELLPTTDPIEQALELARVGRAAEKRRALREALTAYERARDTVAGLAPTPLLVNVLRWLGSVHRDLGDPAQADVCYQESLRVAELTGTVSGQAAALNCRAVIAQRKGDLDDAVRLYRRAARLAAEAGEIRLAGMIEQNLGVLANIRGDLDGALVRYRASLRAFEQVRDDEAVSWVLNNMGMLLNDLGKPERAEGLFLRGLEIARMRGDRSMEATLLTNYAEGLIARQRWADASVALESALILTREGGEPARVAETLKFYGMMERERQMYDQARRYLGEALSIAQSVHDPLLVAEIRREWGEVRYVEGDLPGAADDFTEALNGFERLAATLDANRMRARLNQLEPSGTPPRMGPDR
jgi:tetratricopeptide (TPR) repeat protein